MKTEEGAGLVTGDFDYALPAGLVASRPAQRRDASRLLVLDRSTGELEDRRFADLPGYLRAGDALVVNDTRVFAARLLGRKPTGARAEVLLLRPLPEEDDGRVWQALVRPGGKLKPGRVVRVGDDLQVRIDDSFADGSRRVSLVGEGDPWSLIERHGRVPLPPYISRESDAGDRERYQTVYAREPGSVAAPTAGLHFTAALLERVEARGVSVVPITLHVGVGTFRPVDAERLSDHVLHPERYAVSREAADRLNAARSSGGKVWAVGTTSARTLESVTDEAGVVHAGADWTNLFIHPPFRFRCVDGLLTNFHLPRSTLLMLVAAFAGLDPVLDAYRHAIRLRYRFYSYGDAMLVL